ncbi:AraC family ligand binding domain-containing protein [Faecalimonas umbilicata]|nr:AraC family ligand binding domain-containing protein [Faecalimonas umbilicata]
MHKHAFFEIVYVLSGRCVQSIGLDTHQFHEGDFIFISPDTFHTMEVFDDNSIVINILLRRSTFHEMFAPLTYGNDLLSEFFSSGLYASNQFQYIALHSEKDQFLKNELLKMCEEWLNPDKYTNQILVGILTMIFAYLMRKYSDTLEASVSYHSTMPDDFLILNYMQENLKTVSLSDMQIRNHLYGLSKKNFI